MVAKVMDKVRHTNLQEEIFILEKKMQGLYLQSFVCINAIELGFNKKSRVARCIAPRWCL